MTSQARRQPVPICHINLFRDSTKLRGGERQTEILVQLLADARIRQRVVILESGPLANRLEDGPGLEVRRVSGRVAAVFACQGAALLHAHEAHAAQVAYVASRTGGQYVITRRLIKAIRSNRFSSAVYRNARLLIALTEAVEGGLRGRFEDLDIVRIPDAWIPQDPDADKACAIREKFPGKFLVGHAAAMDAMEKGQQFLIESARTVREEAPEIQFVLLGSGRMEEEFRRQAQGLDNVYFAGWQDDPVTWLSAFDLFAFPSLREPLGSTLLDALRVGLPAVASDAGGIPEILTPECGVLVPPRDADAMAGQILRLFRDEELRRRLSEGARKRAAEFSPQRLLEEHLKIYRELVPGLEG